MVHAAALATHYGAALPVRYVYLPQANSLPPLDLGVYVPPVYTSEDIARFKRSLEQFTPSRSRRPPTARCSP